MSCTTCDCREKEFAKIRAERDELRHQILALFARQHLTCGWCNEMMQAPPGFTPPMTTEKIKQTVRLHLAVCPKHPIRDVEKKRDTAVAALSTIEERYVDGCDTYEDWTFMGETARAFFRENDQGMAAGADVLPLKSD